MHDSVAGDPMWLVTEHGDNLSIDVIRMTNVLSSTATFTYTNLPVTPYSGVVDPVNPNGTINTTNIDSRIQKSAESGHNIVAAHAVSVSPTQDVIQWYRIDVNGTPALADQGRVSAGNNTYLTYPAIDINASGQIGMTYMQSGTNTSTNYMSMYLTGRNASDAAGTMQPSIVVPAETGQANYSDFSGASGVSMTDMLGSLLNYQSATASQGTYSQSGGVVTFTVGSVTAGGTVTATVTAQALEDGSTSNSASARSSSPDPNTANNSSSKTTMFGEPAISVSGPVRTKSRTLTNFQVATFTHASGAEPASAFSATINLGDGTTSAGTITQSGTTHTVRGSHNYSKGGSHIITTTVTEVGQAVDKIDVDPATLPSDERDVVQLPPARKHDLGGDDGNLAAAVQAPSAARAFVVTLTPSAQPQSPADGAAPAAAAPVTGTASADQFFTDLVLAMMSRKHSPSVTDALLGNGA
jgi:hypothetical protein